ncbi:flagellar basal body rod protein FlgB [Photobacterium phosphoreum]|uniref:flagellar basal body rod protein FlgB n=1 Tax=Photobacterium phosphoreum TaxID=659 RepID=UPI0005D3CC36|nr:flagellar basal body rod protein FlgB [Photobacterium phosphoreum]KJF88473.1 flagellar basal body rod protein FlgB [Photobacterium phosphoreum]PQJ90488.1 flagellar basal body rod protein FlgB [Photobacterium phosphoreum]PSV72220.1 flagellar basal body rod protein FlgB [Photobacterium phosphoreum]
MSISFDKALGIHQHTVGTRATRAETLASNLANVNTPGFKAKDVDFSRVLQSATTGANVGLNRTNGRHITASGAASGEQLYRVPTQPDTGDGNTVDAQLEQNLFMQNSIEYQASLDFLGSKFKNLTKALKGE